MAAPPATERPERGVEPRLTFEAMAIVLLAGIGLFVAADALEGVLRLHTALPYWDGWAPVAQWDGMKAGTFGAGDWFTQHNEHRPVLARLFFVLDLAVFGGRNVVEGPLALLVQGSVSLLFAGASLLLFRRRERWPSIVAVCAVAALTLQFSMAQVENFVLPFNVHWILGFGAAAWALALTAMAPGRGGMRRIVLLGGAIFLAVCGQFSIAFAVMAWPAMLGLGRQLRLSRYELAAIAGTGVAVTIAYYVGYESPPGLGSRSELVTDPLNTAGFFLSLIGSPVQPVLGTALARVAGSLGIAAAAWLLADLRFRPRAYGAAGAFLTWELVFVLLAALFITFLHAPQGTAEAELPRYAVGPLAFWTCVLILGWHVMLRRVRGPAAMRIPQGAAAVLVLITAATPWQSEGRYRDALTGLTPTVDAIHTGVYDPGALSRIYPEAQLNDLPPLIGMLKEHGLSIFHGEDDSELIGRPIEDALFLSPGSCLGFFDKILDAESDAGAGVSGWAWDTVNRRNAAKVVIADADGTVIGVATTTDGPRPDVLAGVPAVDTARVGWFGYSRFSEGEATAYAVLPGNVACPLEGERAVTAAAFAER